VTRRTAVIVGCAVAVAAAVELVVLSGFLASERQGDRQRYADALATQRRHAGKSLPISAERAAPTDATEFCVRGVDTFVVAADDSLESSIVTDARRIDVDVLRRRSNMATRAERYVEQAVAGPALSQRMGRSRVAQADGTSTWTTLRPGKIDCGGDEAYATFKLPVDEPAPVEPGDDVTPP
jgi:hypothetical protein